MFLTGWGLVPPCRLARARIAQASVPILAARGFPMGLKDRGYYQVRGLPSSTERPPSNGSSPSPVATGILVTTVLVAIGVILRVVIAVANS